MLSLGKRLERAYDGRESAFSQGHRAPICYRASPSLFHSADRENPQASSDLARVSGLAVHNAPPCVFCAATSWAMVLSSVARSPRWKCPAALNVGSLANICVNALTL